MTKISLKNSRRVASLLERYDEIQRIESKIGKKGICIGLTSTNDNDDSEFESVTIQDCFAKTAIKQQKQHVAAELKKHGIEVS